MFGRVILVCPVLSPDGNTFVDNHDCFAKAVVELALFVWVMPPPYNQRMYKTKINSGYDPVGFGERLRTERKAAGLSQTQLAARANMGNVGLCNWERGLKLPLSANLWRVADALGVPVADLLQPAPKTFTRHRMRNLPLNEALQRAREERGWSVEVMAHMCQIRVNDLRNWEAGLRGVAVSQIFKIAAALKLSLRQLLPAAQIDDAPMPPWKVALLEQLRAARTAAGLSRTQLAKKAQINVLTMREWEFGQVNTTFAQLVRIANALNIAVADLLDPVDGERAPVESNQLVIGEKLQSARLAAGIDVTKMSRLVTTVSTPMLNEIESGTREVRLWTLHRFADALDIPLRQLLLDPFPHPVLRAVPAQQKGRGSRHRRLAEVQGDLGARLRLVRMRAALSTGELAAMAKTTPEMITRWERFGDVDLDWLVRLAQTLNVSTDTLLGLAGTEEADRLPPPPRPAARRGNGRAKAQSAAAPYQETTKNGA